MRRFSVSHLTPIIVRAPPKPISIPLAYEPGDMFVLTRAASILARRHRVN
jgi:hypothetical protein